MLALGGPNWGQKPGPEPFLQLKATRSQGSSDGGKRGRIRAGGSWGPNAGET